MARFRVRLRINPGRTGTPLDKLGEFAIQSEKFLRSLANDLEIPVKKGELLALRFTNESIAWDNEYAGSVSDAVVNKGREAIRALASVDPLSASNRGLVTYSTLAEFSRLGKSMDPDEKFLIGVYDDEIVVDPEWAPVTYHNLAEIRQFLEVPLVIHGSVQGTLHAWHPGADPRFMTVRDLLSGTLVRCVYSQTQYMKVQAITEKPNMVFHVMGDISWDQSNNTITELRIKEIEPVASLTEFEFDSVFGSNPTITGDRSTSEFIDLMRGDDE